MCASHHDRGCKAVMLESRNARARFVSELYWHTCRRVRITPLVVLVLSAFLSACSSALENPFTIFADPAKYEYHSCEMIAAERKRLTDRERC